MRRNNNSITAQNWCSDVSIPATRGNNSAPNSVKNSSFKSKDSSLNSIQVANEETMIKRALAASRTGGLSASLIHQESLLKVWEPDDDDVYDNNEAIRGPQEHQQQEAVKVERKPDRSWIRLLCKKPNKSPVFDENSRTFSQNMDDIDRMKSHSFTRRALEKIRKKRASSIFTRFRSTNNVLYKNSGVDVSDYSRMQRLVMEMKDCIFMLENTLAPEDRLEEWACVVYESMSASSRTFHGVQHVFDMAEEADEVQKLAAYFHDCIYYNIDGGLSNVQKKFLNDIIVESDEGVFLTKDKLEEDVELVTEVFGFEAGQKLNPFKGLNEYLSAVLAVRCFAKLLSQRYQCEVAACIEATIPFRDGDPMEELYQRLVKVNEKYNLNMSDAELEVTTKRAADFSNRDVYNFSLANRAVFLSNTWNLLPESNINLRHAQVFRISDFAFALQKMTGFFSTLKAETIFTSFRNQPSNETIDDLTQKARENIEIALTYMNCKRLSIAVLAAFAELTGGDAPVAMFLGDLPDANYISPSIEDMIRIRKKKKGVELDDRVLALLKEGRESESKFDIKNSPCAALLYANMGDEGLEESLKHVVHPMDEEHAKALLLSLPKSCVTEIGLACCHIAITRSHAMRSIVEKIQKGSSL